MVEIHANLLAPIAIGAFPLFIIALFLLYRPPTAVAVSLLVSEMFLPSSYFLPIHPTWVGKWALPPFVTLLGAVVFARSYTRGSKPFRGIEFSFLVWLIGCFFTYWTNRDPLQFGPATIPGEVFADFANDALHLLCDPFAMFFLGRVIFRTSRDLVSLHRIAIISALVYTIPVLYEVRMSPQVSNLLYGFVPSAWGMVYRWGGYRPLGLFPTGLHLTSFMLALTVMAVAASRCGIRVRYVPKRAAWIYLAVVLVLCKSTGVILYAAALVPLVLFASPRRMGQIARILTAVFLAYPILRYFDLIPVDAIVNLFSSNVSSERAGSLGYRFDMEKGMMDLTRLRPWWGWGGYGRAFVHDPVTGGSTSIPDGALVINLSTHGWVGFYAYFLPYAYAIFRLPRLIRKIQSRNDRLLLSALALNCAVILFDLIINSSFFPIFMVFMGALYGLPTSIAAEEARAHAQGEAETHDPISSYRQSPDALPT